MKSKRLIRIIFLFKPKYKTANPTIAEMLVAKARPDTPIIGTKITFKITLTITPIIPLKTGVSESCNE